jgi:hypothetical protein
MEIGKWKLVERLEDSGTGVICETWALQAAVIPAKAGIYSTNLRKCAVDGMDSRFRGNDRCFERDPIPKDTTTRIPNLKQPFSIFQFPVSSFHAAR